MLPSWLKNLFVDDGAISASSGDRANLGIQGEMIAARHLQGLKYQILLRNFRVPAGEVDIIAREGKVLVFVEVKTRASADLVAPEQQVNRDKEDQVRRVAQTYLTRYGTTPPVYRYDVVTVIPKPDGRHEVTHFPNAFTD